MLVTYTYQVANLGNSLPLRPVGVNLYALITIVVLPTTLLFFSLHSLVFLLIIIKTTAQIVK